MSGSINFGSIMLHILSTELDAVMDQISPQEQTSSTEWRQRQKMEEEHWQQKRPQLFGSFISAHGIPNNG